MFFFSISILYKIAIFWIIAVVTPGPNFILTINSSFMYGKKKSLFSVLGITSGTSIWALSGYLGVSVLFLIAPWIYRIIKTIGALYLIYLGIKKLLAKQQTKYIQNQTMNFSVLYHYKKGLLVNLSNPKTAIFISSLFATIIPKDLNWSLGLFSVIIICAISFTWYSMVCLIFSHKKIVNSFSQLGTIIEKLSGAFFILFGLKILTYDTVHN